MAVICYLSSVLCLTGCGFKAVYGNQANEKTGTTDSAISRIESGERAISLETLRKLGVALDIVFLVGSTDAATAVAADPRAVVVPEAPIETTSVKEPRQAVSTPHKRSVKLARGGGPAIPAVPALRLRADSGG